MVKDSTHTVDVWLTLMVFMWRSLRVAFSTLLFNFSASILL